MTLPDLTAITAWLISLETIFPLPVFVVIGSVLEELISPIPATLVLGVAGSFVALNKLSIAYLIFLTVLGTLGKTLAAWVTYWLGRSLGEYFITRWGKYFGVKATNITAINLKLKSKKSWWLTFAMRAFPIAPSAAVSIAAGIIHTRQWIFLTATFTGYIIRNSLTALAGYAGIDIFANWQEYAGNPIYGIIAAVALTTIALYFLMKSFQKYYSTPASPTGGS